MINYYLRIPINEITLARHKLENRNVLPDVVVLERLIETGKAMVASRGRNFIDMLEHKFNKSDQVYYHQFMKEFLIKIEEQDLVTLFLLQLDKSQLVKFHDSHVEDRYRDIVAAYKKHQSKRIDK